MIDTIIDTLLSFPRGLVLVAEGLIVLALAKVIKDLAHRHYRMDAEVAEKGNIAIALRLSGYFLAIIIILTGVLYQPFSFAEGGWFSYSVLVDNPRDYSDSLGFNWDFFEVALRVFLYSLGGIVALNLTRALFDRLILYKFHLEKEVVEDRNIGAGAAEFGMYIAAGLVIGGSLAGDTGGFVNSELDSALVSLAFFALGMLLLIAFALFYQFTTAFDIHSEIERDNIAVGVAMGGNLIAIGLVAFKAVFGDFTGWGESIAAFLTYGVLGFALLYVVRLLIDLFLLPRVKIAQALSGGRNVGVALVESSVVIGAALILLMAV